MRELRRTTDDVDDDVLPDQIASLVRSCSRRVPIDGIGVPTRAFFWKLGESAALDDRSLREQFFAERNVLRRPLRLHQHQQHRVIGGKVVAALVSM